MKIFRKVRQILGLVWANPILQKVLIEWVITLGSRVGLKFGFGVWSAVITVAITVFAHD